MESETLPDPPLYNDPLPKPDDVTPAAADDTNLTPDIPKRENSGEKIEEEEDTKPKYTPPQPRNLACPTPLPRDIANDEATMFSGSKFHPVLHQSRRDMYGGEPRKGIPNGFQNILYDISNCVLKKNNYGQMDPNTKKVFNDITDIYECLASQLEYRLAQREIANGKKTGWYYQWLIYLTHLKFRHIIQTFRELEKVIPLW